MRLLFVDCDRCGDLPQFMQEKGLYETSAEFQLRVDVLQLLLELVPAWVKIVARHLGKAEMEVADADGSVLTYGSFRLSTHGPGVWNCRLFGTYIETKTLN